MALFSHEDKQAIYKLSDMATELRKDFFKIFGKIKIFWVIFPIAVTILLSFVFGGFVIPLYLNVLMIFGVPILFILKFILYYKISKIQKQDKYDNDELLWYEFLNQLVSFFLWFILFVFITSLFIQLAGVTMF
ncbi:hypothetical protein E3U40_10215 [Campylobacter fetus subsp. venerealis]|uniref:hypothetical protein n=1 Tax=Campylobacter fetus TaxID=196 RepID=UPI0003D94966|nr:hypothetical protein [Campylobacter fetus]AHE95200.1 hypothetical protein CFVI03293_A0075 [Campylobacter fetus subsp. venerealis cfvi03/293]KAA3682574.1 hypothetical protein E3U40_10215 [Campylobacter fetus subsp. venerealis]OCS20982.1 hypothetical protein CFVI97532_09805 [Campylobacter fetus subsp. venerealis cfvi97/532]